jgi:hypothetical protein
MTVLRPLAMRDHVQSRKAASSGSIPRFESKYPTPDHLMAGLEKTASTRALGAIGIQRCLPAASSAKLCPGKLLG